MWGLPVMLAGLAAEQQGQSKQQGMWPVESNLHRRQLQKVRNEIPFLESKGIK